MSTPRSGPLSSLTTGPGSGQLQLWVLRGAWLLLAPTCGPALIDAVNTTSSLAGGLVEGALWGAWFAGLVATLVPHPISLTLIRILAPTVAGNGLLIGFVDGWNTNLSIAVAYGLFATSIAFLPAVGDRMVNGSAYGSERRMALRAPATALVGPVPLAWFITFAGLVGWAWAAAAGRLTLAVGAAVVGLPLALAAARVLHQLSRRWVVFVPAGFVLHDMFHLTEPVLLARNRIVSLGPAPAGEDPTRLDFSGGALGLALEVETAEQTTFSQREGRNAAVVSGNNIVFSPTLPGALLSEARVRGIKIGAPSHVAGEPPP